MNQQSRQLGLNLESVAKALAEWTVSRMSETDASLAERYGARWRQGWVGEVQQLLAYLAQALAVERPEIVRLAVEWSASAFAARGCAREDLGCMLDALIETIRDRLPEDQTRSAIALLADVGSALEAEPAAPRPALDSHSEDGTLALRYLEAILQGSRGDAEETILTAARDGMTVPAIYDRLLQPALVEIGRMWHSDEITVADEHFAITVTEGVIARLRDFCPPSPPNGRTVVTTTVAGELHGVGVHMLSDLLEMDGWRVLALGSNTPAADIVQCLGAHRADLLAVSVTSFLNLRSLADLIDAVRTPDLGDVRILVGGGPFRIIEDLWEAVGADSGARTAVEGVESANRLVGG